MNEDENLFPHNFQTVEADFESLTCEIKVEKMLDIYLAEQIDEEFENHLLFCSSCQEKLGLCHQFVTEFAKAYHSQPDVSLRMAQTANGGKYEKTTFFFEC